jgi:hypothetical protein
MTDGFARELGSTLVFDVYTAIFLAFPPPASAINKPPALRDVAVAGYQARRLQMPAAGRLR